MSTKVRVHAYTVTYRFGGQTGNDEKYFANIHFRKPSGQPMGVAFFYSDPADMPDTDSQNAPGNGIIHCHLPAQHFSAVLDLLRNESPIYLTYDEDKHLAYISTSLERVGEGEGE